MSYETATNNKNQFDWKALPAGEYVINEHNELIQVSDGSTRAVYDRAATKLIAALKAMIDGSH